MQKYKKYLQLYDWIILMIANAVMGIWTFKLGAIFTPIANIICIGVCIYVLIKNIKKLTKV